VHLSLTALTLSTFDAFDHLPDEQLFPLDLDARDGAPMIAAELDAVNRRLPGTRWMRLMISSAWNLREFTAGQSILTKPCGSASSAILSPIPNSGPVFQVTNRYVRVSQIAVALVSGFHREEGQ
jgi:hypothetical protein